MVDSTDCLKTIIYINYDIPFDFKEEREKVFEKIVDSLHSAIGFHEYEFKMTPNYTTNDMIIIFKIKGNSDSWRRDIKRMLDNMHTINIYDSDTESVYEYENIDYMVEFSNTKIYSILTDR